MIIVYLIALILFTSPAYGTIRYVDGRLGSNCAGNSYSIANHNCSGSDGPGYPSANAGISSSASGDTIYVRGASGSFNGVYVETIGNIIPSSTVLSGYGSENPVFRGTTAQHNG